MNLIKSQPIKIALGIIIGLAVITTIALAIGARNGQNTISQKDASDIALREANVNESDIVSLDVSDKNTFYTVMFKTADKSYSYDVNKSGEVIRASFSAGDEISNDPSVIDTVPQQDTTITDAQIDEAKAKEIALNDAGVNESDCSFMFVKGDYDDGIAVFEVEFMSNGSEYDYKISKADGAIISKDFDIENYRPSGGSDIIDRDKAVSIALGRVQGATQSNIKIELDYDDGYPYYEGEIYYDGVEYEFEIDAYSGNVIEWSIDRW